jgi:hypothetical protein
MTWDGLSGVGVTGSLGPYDSDRFGVSVARITVGHKAPDAHRAAAEVDNLVRLLEAEVSVVRWPASLNRIGDDLSRLGYALVPADTLVYWSAPLDEWTQPPRDFTTLGETPAIAAALPDAVRRTFAGYVNHYSASAVFDSDAVLAGYVDWAIRDATARPFETYALAQGGQNIEGFATTSPVADGLCLEVNLAGIVPEARGAGRYGRLMSGMMAISRTKGYQRLVISTQAGNCRVQAAWVHIGLRPFAAFTTVHVTAPERNT